jgi:hypothetical protein
MVHREFRKMHESVTLDRVLKAAERYEYSLDNPGICIACGMDAEGCEPDARNYECVFCGQKKVFGASELLMNMI